MLARESNSCKCAMRVFRDRWDGRHRDRNRSIHRYRYEQPSTSGRGAYRTAAMRAPGVGDWVMPCDCAFGEVGRADRLERGRSLPPGRLGGYLRRHGELSCTGHRRQQGHRQGDRAPARRRRPRRLGRLPRHRARRTRRRGDRAAAPGCSSWTSPTRRASPPPRTRSTPWTSWSTTRASPATARQQTETMLAPSATSMRRTFSASSR